MSVRATGDVNVVVARHLATSEKYRAFKATMRAEQKTMRVLASFQGWTLLCNPCAIVWSTPGRDREVLLSKASRRVSDGATSCCLGCGGSR